MQTKKSLSLQIAGATALAMLFGTSAFAESRHHSGTSSSSGGHSDRSSGSRSSGSRSSGSRSSGSSVQRDQSASRSQSRSSDRGSWQNGQSQRNTTREFSQRDNNTQRSSDWRGNNSQRSDSRGINNQRSDSRYNNSRSGQRSIASDRFRSVAGWRPGGRAPYAVHERVSSFGRVDRFERWNGGYRVWLGGGLYPIFVPFERWRLFPLRIGLNIRFGGFWDPLGYWSVYDYSPYDGYYGGGYANVYGYNDGYNNDAYTSGEVRGTVESIDFRRGTMVINDDTSRQFVTITLPRDRRIDDIRAGDYVEFSGGWTRRGVFEASRLERFDEGRGDGQYDRNDPRNDDRRY